MGVIIIKKIILIEIVEAHFSLVRRLRTPGFCDDAAGKGKMPKGAKARVFASWVYG